MFIPLRHRFVVESNSKKKSTPTVTATWGILLRHAHHIAVTDHLSIRQQVSTDAHTHGKMRTAIVWQSPTAVTLVSKQQHTTMTLLLLCQVSPGSCSSQLITCSLKLMVFYSVFCCCAGKISATLRIQIAAFICSSPVVFEHSTCNRRRCHQLFHSCSFPWGHRLRYDNVLDSLNVLAGKWLHLMRKASHSWPERRYSVALV